MHRPRLRFVSRPSRRILVSVVSVLCGLLLVAQSAAAEPGWQLFSLQTTPENAPKVAAALDELMASPIGKQHPGRLLLHVVMAGGASPVTHNIVSLHPSSAAREAWVAKLQQDAAWAKFQSAYGKLAQPVSTVRYATLASWGDVEDTDAVWMAHAFDVQDPEAFAAALDRFMKSETGKKFPGQVHLSQVVAAGMSPQSHTISVGYASEAEMEEWQSSLRGNPDWRDYLVASRASSEYLGANLVREIKAWGGKSLAELTAQVAAR